MKKPDYEIKIEINRDPAYHPYTVKVTSARYYDGTEISGKNIRKLLDTIAKWIEEPCR